jgi:hypothetical protein
MAAHRAGASGRTGLSPLRLVLAALVDRGRSCRRASKLYATADGFERPDVSEALRTAARHGGSRRSSDKAGAGDDQGRAGKRASSEPAGLARAEFAGAGPMKAAGLGLAHGSLGLLRTA